MPKVPLNTITSGYGTVDALNANFDAIETAFDNTLSRDGDTPNQMSANLDMNGFNILNQGNPITVSGFNWEGQWLTATAYQVGDVVQQTGSAYICVVAHTSGVFATDLAALKWQLVVQANLPTQTGNSGKYLTTNGTSASWDDIKYTPLGTGAVQRTVTSKVQETVSVKDFGAVGDGVTDDTSAIQAALDLGPYCSIYFPAGTYIVTNLTVGPDVTMHGDGLTNTQLKLKNGASGAILSSSNATHLAIQDIGFNGNYTNCPSGTQCVEISGAEVGGNGFWIDRCGFFNAKGIGFYQTGTYSKARISECIAENNQIDGIVFNASGSIAENNRCVLNGRFGILAQGNFAQIMGNTCTNNGQTMTGGAGIAVITGDFPVVSNNTCLSNGIGTYFTHGIQFNGVTNGVMEGNFSQGNNGSGLDMFQSQYTTCTGNQSLNNKVRGIENDTSSFYSTIDGNVVIGNFEVGISVFNTIGSVVSNNIVVGNGTLGTAANPLTGMTNAPYGIALWGAGSYGNNTMILGNQVSQNVGSGANGVGLWIDASCVNVTMTNNQFAGNTVNMTALKANFKTVKDNQGVWTEQTGAVSLGGGATSASVTFSPALALAPTPASIKLMPYNLPASNMGPVAITAVSATGFTFNTYAAPGGAGVTFDWSVSVFP